jgi:hypothetical protein
MRTETTTPPPVRHPFRTPVRGHAFAARLPGATGPRAGQLARLVREPSNPADPLAVGVWVADHAGGWRIGYLDRTVAARIAPRLDAGLRIAAQVEGWTGEPEGRWHRPLLVLLPDDRAPQRSAEVTAPRLWGRPPGVSRRRLAPRDGGDAAS